MPSSPKFPAAPASPRRSRYALKLHQRRMRTGSVPRGVAGDHDIDVAGLLEVRIADCLAGCAADRLGTWENPGCPQIHMRICYYKSLKSRKESV